MFDMLEQPAQPDTIMYGVRRALLRSLWVLFMLIPPLVFLSPLWWLAHIAVIGPLIFRFRDNGQREAMKGVIIVAALGLLINGGCDMMIFGQLH